MREERKEVEINKKIKIFYEREKNRNGVMLLTRKTQRPKIKRESKKR